MTDLTELLAYAESGKTVAVLVGDDPDEVRGEFDRYAAAVKLNPIDGLVIRVAGGARSITFPSGGRIDFVTSMLGRRADRVIVEGSPS